jgi:hypothetical protein
VDGCSVREEDVDIKEPMKTTECSDIKGVFGIVSQTLLHKLYYGATLKKTRVCRVSL